MPRLTPLERTVAVLLGLLLVVLTLHRLTSLDVWWQLAAGRWIVEHGIPATDPFSFGFPGREWIEPRWLYCVAVHLVERAGGFDALVVGKVAVVAATFGVLAAGGDRRAPWSILVGLALALAVGHERFAVRPELVTFFSLAAVLLCLERYRRGGGVAWLLALPPLQLLWSNAHTLWVLGPATLAIVFLAETAQTLAAARWPAALGRPDRLVGRRLRGVAVVGALLLAAAFVNPYGVDGVLFPLRLFDEIGEEHVLGQSIAEFLGPLSEPLFRFDYRTIAFFVVAAGSGGTFLLRRRAPSLPRLALWAAYLYLAFRAQRNGALFGLVAGHAAMLNLAEAWDEPAPCRRGRLAVVLAAAVGLWALAMIPWVASDAFYRDQGWTRRSGLGVSDRRFPVRPLAFVRGEGLPTPVLHGLGDGGYVIWEGGAGSAYADGRLEVYGAEAVERALALTRQGIGLEPETRRTGARTAIVRNDARDAGLLRALERSREWVPVYFDPRHVVYLRETAETAALVSRLRIDWERPVARTIARPASFEAPAWLERFWPRASDNFESERLGTLFVQVGSYDRAFEEWERALAERPGDRRARLHLGLFLRAKGRHSEAVRLLDAVPSSWLERRDVRLLAAELSMWVRDPAAALVHYRRVVALGSDAGALAGLARAAIAVSRFDEARGALAELLARDGRDPEAHALLGVCSLREGREEEARAHLVRSLELDPDQPRVRALLDDLTSSGASP